MALLRLFTRNSKSKVPKKMISEADKSVTEATEGIAKMAVNTAASKGYEVATFALS